MMLRKKFGLDGGLMVQEKTLQTPDSEDEFEWNSKSDMTSVSV
jgi:hypothetical protein